MTEIPDDILDRATQTFHQSLRDNADYAVAVAAALSVGAPLFAAHELRRIANIVQLHASDLDGGAS